MRALAPAGAGEFMPDVAAPVQTRGATSDRAVACAQRKLLGQEIAMTVPEPGTTFRMPFPLAF